MADVSNSENVLDSRDVEARIEELESERADLEEALTEAHEALEGHDDPTDEHAAANKALEEARAELTTWEEENGEELKTLLAFREELEPYCSDWQHGETLIRDSYFEEYAQELAEEIGAISQNMQWPANCIDWEKAARELQMDYTSGEFDGVTYWAR